MKLTTTRNLITNAYGMYPHFGFLERFDHVYPNIDPDQEVSLLDMLNDGIINVFFVIWCLRATVQDSRNVSAEFAKRCAARVVDAAWAVDVLDDITWAVDAAEECAANDVNWAAAAKWAHRAADATVECFAFNTTDLDTFDAAWEIERDKQKQDMIELLS
jgi:hypothetical protein